MAEFEECEFGDLPFEKVEQLKESATLQINDFTVSFALDNDLCGSGTLVDAFGTLGILTAFHVVEQWERDPDSSLCLIVARHAHRFELPRDTIQHIPLGEPNALDPERGPDLSFLKLTGPPQLSTLRSIKSFYRVEGRSFNDFDGMPLEKVFWWIAGAPESRARPMTSTSVEGALRALHLIAQVGYLDRQYQGDFDVLKLDANAEGPPFASNYRGCSGGGVWLSPLTMDPAQGRQTLGILPPMLVGVAYFQGPLVGGRRYILANGPKSIERLSVLRRIR